VKGIRRDGGLYSIWIKMWTNISWHRMKKSSKAALMPTRKETKPMNRARIAHPLNKLNKFLKLLLSPILLSGMSTYLVICVETACCPAR